MNVITVTPAGRKKYLEILIPYLLKYIKEHHFWLNTENKEDIKYIREIATKYPDFFKINKKKMFNPTGWLNIWQYFKDYTKKNTIYIRIDDDICFIEKDAIPKLIEYRKKNRKPFLISGNVINNSCCVYYHQQKKLISTKTGKIKSTKITPLTVTDGNFVEQLHNTFLHSIKNNKVKDWEIDNKEVIQNEGFHVNVIAWFGKDMAKVKEIKIKDLRDVNVIIDGKVVNAEWEERFISRILPLRYSRPSEICGKAIFAHFAFTNQRRHLEDNTNLLLKYKEIAESKIKEANRCYNKYRRVNVSSTYNYLKNVMIIKNMNKKIKI